MATVSERLQFILDVNNASAVKGVQEFGKESEKALDAADKKLDQLGSRMTKVGAGAVAFAGVAGAALWKVGGIAGDQNAAVAAMEQSFGAASDSIMAFADTSVRAVGLSKTAALEATTSFAGIARQMGLGEEAAASFAIKQVQLAADLAAFKNVSPEQALQDLVAAYSGSTEVMQKYQVSLNDTILKQTLLAETGEKVTGTLTPQQKALAIQIALMEQTAKQQGQWNREIDSNESKQAMLKASLDDLAASIGQGVVPVMSTMLDGIKGVVEAFNSLPAPVREAIGKTAALGTAVVGVGGALTLGVGQAIRFRDSIKSMNPALVAGGVALGALGVALSAWASDKAEAKARTMEFVQALKEEEEAQNGALDALIRRRIADDDLVAKGDAVGLSIKETAAAIKGEQIPALEEMLRLVERGNGDLTLASTILKKNGYDVASGDVLVYARSVGRVNDEYEKGLELKAQDEEIERALTEDSRRRSAGLAEQQRFMSSYGTTVRQTVSRLEEWAYAQERAAETAAEAKRQTEGYDQAIQDLLGTLDRGDALANLESSFDDLKTATEEFTSAWANGQDDAKEKGDAAAQQLRDTKRQVIEFASEILHLPPERITEFIAQIDQGDLDKVEERLAWIARTREIALNLNVGGSAPGASVYSGGGGGANRRAQGTITSGPELALIGEDGTEAVLPLTKPDRIRALMAEPGVASAILGALSGGKVTAMANGGIVTRGAIRGSGGMSVELRGTSFGDALDTVFSGYASLLGATDSLTEAQHGLNDAFHENGRTLDVNTEKGRANRDAVVSNWEAIKDLAQAQFEQGASVEDVTEAMRGNVAQLRQQIEFFGLAPDQVDAYLASMGATEEAIGQVTAALAEQQRVADVERQVRTEDYLYSHQKLSADRYLAILRGRLVGLEKYSTEWIRIMDDIDRVEQDKAAAQEQRERDFADRLKKRQDALAEWASGVEDAFARSDDAAEGAQKVADGLAGIQRAVWEDGIGAGSQGRQSVLDQLNAIADAATARVQAGESIGSVQGSVNADIVALRRAVVAGGGSAAEFDRLRAQTGRTTSDYGALLRATATQQAIKIDAPITVNGSNLTPAQIAAAVQKGIQTAADAAARKLRAA